MEERKIWGAERGRGDCDVSSLCSHSKKERPADGRKGGLDWRFMREDYGWRMRVGSVERWEVGGGELRCLIDMREMKQEKRGVPGSGGRRRGSMDANAGRVVI